MKIVVNMLIYLFGAPLVGGLLAGLDRKITAHMQGRKGPPLFQPFYDVAKLFQKENLVVRRSQNLYIIFFLIFIIFTGGLFFAGDDILLVIFAFTLGSIFFVLAGHKASSPYSFSGAQRELLQIMAYEPAVIFTAIGMYMVTKSFNIACIVQFPHPLIFYLPGLFLAFLYILAIKFRKSPFDLSTSHHAHQEIVKGITTEFSGQALAMIEIAFWYEHVFVLGLVYLFFAAHVIAGLLITLGIFFLVIFVDNACARAKWQLTLASAWIIALVCGFGNIIALYFLKP